MSRVLSILLEDPTVYQAKSTFGPSGISVSLMILGAAMIAIAILIHVVTMMRFDRLAEEGSLGPDPEGFDPAVETRREFHARTRVGVTFGLVAFGGLALLISVITLIVEAVH